MRATLPCGFLPVLILLVTLGVPAGPSAAFELLRRNRDSCDQSNQNLAWSGAVALVDTSQLAALGLEDEALLALDRWNRAGRTFRFASGDGSLCESGDGVITLGFRRESCGGNRLSASTLAVTRFRWNSRAELTDGDIVFNPDAPAFDEPQVFFEVVMHELGHVLGLEHADACGKIGEHTLMRASIFINAPRFPRPQADDIAGLNFIYPGNGSLCAGDCNRNGVVTVDELLIVVNEALGGTAVICPAADGDGDSQISVAELVTAVQSAVFSCTLD